MGGRSSVVRASGWLGVVLLCGLTGCATLFTGTRDTIRFDSDPRGAEVYINGERICRTPCQTPVRRSMGIREASLRLDGYETRVFRLETDFNYVSLLNLSFLVGWAVDIATGAIIRYDRRDYRFDLVPAPVSAWRRADTIRIDTVRRRVDILVRTD